MGAVPDVKISVRSSPSWPPPACAQELVKTVGKLAEQGKIALRNVRRDALKEISALTGLSEDTVKEAEESVQKLTDTYVKKVEELSKSKEEELMTV